MEKNKDNIKENNLKQIGIVIIFTILLILIGYIILPNESEISNNILSKDATINTINETNINIGIGDIPQYSGQIVISINNDVPYFKDNDITTDNFEDYSLLDEFDRAGVAFANICKYTMPKKRN